jgi:hypothetical protein
MTRPMCAALLVVTFAACEAPPEDETASHASALAMLRNPSDPSDPADPPAPRDPPSKPAPPPVVYSAPAVPPPLGPPAPTDPIGDLGVQSILTAVLRNKVDEAVAEINATNAMATSGVRAKVSWDFDVWGPSLFATQYTDRPNENYVNVPYILDFTIYDIEKHTSLGWISVPATRHITQSVDLQMFCDQWQTGQGHLKLVPHADPPYLENDQGTLEQVVDFFLAHTVTSYIDSKVRAKMSGFQASTGIGSLELPGQCDALGRNAGSPTDLSDDVIQFSYHPPRFRPLPTWWNQVTVQLTAVKRLVAHDLHGGVLYDAVETPAIEAYANYQHMYMQLPAMVEGQTMPVNGPTMVLDRPGINGMMVLIGNIILPSRTESAFNVYGAASNFGNGTQSLIVRKSYWMPANPRLGTKPYQIFVDAYELVFQVNAPVPVVAQSFTTAL